MTQSYVFGILGGKIQTNDKLYSYLFPNSQTLLALSIRQSFIWSCLLDPNDKILFHLVRNFSNKL